MELASCAAEGSAVRLHSSYCAFGKPSRDRGCARAVSANCKSMASGPDQAQKVEEKLTCIQHIALFHARNNVTHANH